MTSKPPHVPVVSIHAEVTHTLRGRAGDDRPGRRVPGSEIYDLAPIGSVIRFRDGAPRPPRDRPDALKAWALFNGLGRLAIKDPAPHQSPLPHPVSITLRTAEFGSSPAAGLTISLAEPAHRGISFEIVEVPPIGSIRILRRFADNVELLHLAADHYSAVRWLARNPVTTAIFDLVTADEIAAAVVEGRRIAP